MGFSHIRTSVSLQKWLSNATTATPRAVDGEIEDWRRQDRHKNFTSRYFSSVSFSLSHLYSEPLAESSILSLSFSLSHRWSLDPRPMSTFSAIVRFLLLLFFKISACVTVHCPWTVILGLWTVKNKMNNNFSHIKKLFCYSVFSFQFSVSAKISYIQMNP